MQGVGYQRERVGEEAHAQLGEREGEIEDRADREGSAVAGRRRVIGAVMVVAMTMVVVVMLLVH